MSMNFKKFCCIKDSVFKIKNKYIYKFTGSYLIATLLLNVFNTLCIDFFKINLALTLYPIE
jgi:hypothetical protein